MAAKNFNLICGGDTGLGCQQHPGGVSQLLKVKQQGKQYRNIVFCRKCAGKIKERR